MFKKISYPICMLFLALTWSQCTISRNKNRDHVPPPPTGRNAMDQACHRNGNLSATERAAKYPFNKAKKVIFIAFNGSSDRTPVHNSRLDTGQTMAIKVLDKNQLNTLTDLIFNYNYSKKNQLRTYSEPGCYIPRNAILFIDEKEQIFAYLEICFECYKYESSEEQINLGVSCNNKLDLVKKLFESAGVTTTPVPFEEPAPVLRSLPGEKQ